MKVASLILVTLISTNCMGIDSENVTQNGEDQINTSTTFLRMFNEEQTMGMPKCCPIDHIVTDDPTKGIICVPILQSEFLNYFNQTISDNVSAFNKSVSSGIPSCSSGRPRILNNRDGIWFRISRQTNEVTIGLDYFIWAAWIPVDKDSFCIGLDQTSYEKLLMPQDYNFNDTDVDYVLVFCKLDDDILYQFNIHRYIYGLSSLFTCVPILITLAIFVRLKIHVNPRKWVMMSYFFAYCCVCGVHGVQILVYLNNLEHEATFLCHLLNHMFLYFICVFGTACMFMSLDIFWCFWSMNAHLGLAKAPKAGSVIVILITWLGPLALYIGGEVWREYYGNLVPDLAWKKCTSLNLDIIEFLMTIQFVFKFGVYISTSLLIYRHKKSTSFATMNAQKDFKESQTLYLKLFVTTGMPFTSLTLDYCFAYENPMALYWFIIRFPHGFIGMYIFLVFGFSREVRRKWRLARMSPQDKAAIKAVKASNDSNRSDTSQGSRTSCLSQTSNLTIDPSNSESSGGCVT